MRPYLENPSQKGLLEWLKVTALSSNLSTAKKKKKKVQSLPVLYPDTITHLATQIRDLGGFWVSSCAILVTLLLCFPSHSHFSPQVQTPISPIACITCVHLLTVPPSCCHCGPCKCVPHHMITSLLHHGSPSF
jgi:hypothetical protein